MLFKYSYNQPPGAWVEAELESKELLAFCLKKITGKKTKKQKLLNDKKKK